MDRVCGPRPRRSRGQSAPSPDKLLLPNGDRDGRVAGPHCAGREVRLADRRPTRQYEPSELRSLEYTEADVEEMADVLERAGYPRENIRVMTQARSMPRLGAKPL